MIMKNANIAIAVNTDKCYNAAVEVRNLCLKFGQGINAVNVVDKLSLFVPSASIFGLIGPSGCGKTSLLRCIIGYVKPTSGEIKIFGHRARVPGSGIPGHNLGYMPQEIALNFDLTIDEMLTYFGKILIKDNSLLERRKEELYLLLGIKKPSQLIGTLSGGQQRRVSFACSIVSRPKLIILDEPTVGCDPLLRQKIWCFLEKLSKVDRSTIIITTHYIEETRRADYVAFMRNGSVVTQNSPNYYLQTYQCKSLEAAFLQICSKNSPAIQESVQCVRTETPFLTYDEITYKDYIRTVYTVTERIFFRLYNQKAFLYCTILCHLFGIIVFGNFFCRVPRDLSLGIVNEETPPNLSVVFMNELENSSSLREIVRPRYYKDYNRAEQAVKNGEVVAFLHFKQNFSESFLSRILMDDDVDDKVFNQSSIVLRVDATNKVVITTLERVLAKNYENFVKKSLDVYGYNPKLSTMPLSIAEPIYGKISKDDFFSVKEFVLPQVVCYLAYCYALETVIFSLIREKSELMFERNFALGVTTDQLLFGHFIINFLFNSISALPYFLCSVYLFGVPCHGSLILAYITLLMQIAMGVSTGMLFSAISLSFFLLSIFVFGYILGIFFVGGIMWPMESLPYFIKLVRHFIPFVPSTDSFRHIMVKGFHFTHPSVYSGYIISLFMLTLLLSATRFMFRYSR